MIANAGNGWRERAFGPSLFLGLGFALAVLATPTRSWTAWALAALVLGAGVTIVPHREHPSRALWPILAFGAWLVVHTLFISPVYRPEGVYAGVLFACAAVLAARVGERALATLVRLWLTGVAVLGVWGLAQSVAGVATLFGISGRANALFPSPNTLASVLDVALLATLSVTLGAGRRVGAGLLALVLFAALVATQSRGGALAFAFGMSVLVVCARKAGISIPARVWTGLLLGALAVVAIFEWLSLPTASSWSVGGPMSGSPSLAGRAVAASTEGHAAIRLELYRLAWESLALHPITGSGYLSFAVLYKASGLEILLAHGTTPYVHNDYLQLWLETGLPGVIALLAALGFAARRGWGRLSAAPAAERLRCCAALAGLAALSVHAAVDFPLYVPGLMVLGGAAIGVLCREPARPVSARQPSDDDSLSRPNAVNLSRIARCVLLLAACGWLAAPAVAEWSAYAAERALQSGDTHGALAGYARARALAPYNPHYHWALGVIRAQYAVATGNRQSAAEADRHFAAGAAADRGDVLNPLHRLRLNRDHSSLLPVPRGDSELVDWAERLRDRQPGNLSLQLEYMTTLVRAQRIREARAELERLMARFPKAEQLRTLHRKLATLPSTGPANPPRRVNAPL